MPALKHRQHVQQPISPSDTIDAARPIVHGKLTQLKQSHPHPLSQHVAVKGGKHPFGCRQSRPIRVMNGCDVSMYVHVSIGLRTCPVRCRLQADVLRIITYDGSNQAYL